MPEISQEIQSPQNKRIVLIDTLRGLALVYMVFFHFVYDMAFLIQSEWGRTAFEFNSKIVIFDTASFILLAGISSAFSRSNLKRGGKLLAIGILFTLVTAFVFPGEAIYFGILQLLGSCMVLYGAFEDKLRKIPAILMIVVCAAIFALTYNIQLGFVGIKGVCEIPLPAELTANNMLYPYGILKGGFYSVDYEPLLPWFFLYFGGTYIGGLIVKYREKLPKFCYANFLPPISFIGRHSLLIYILHQPIILAVVYGIQFLMNL
jgi:uncharacterized membrane protein